MRGTDRAPTPAGRLRRVSTYGQTLNVQLNSLHTEGCAKRYREKASGSWGGRRELQRMLKTLASIDVITVTRIDRLVRSTLDLFASVKRIVDGGGQFRLLAELWADTAPSTGRLMLGGLADAERHLIHTRTAEVRSRAKMRGHHIRSPARLSASQQAEVRERCDDCATHSKMARSYTVSPATTSRLTRKVMKVARVSARLYGDASAGLYQPALLGVVLLLSLCAVFSTQLLTGFGLLTGDRLDGLIQVSILEHWFNVLRGKAAWDTTNYFYPYRGTLAYNDGYFLYGLAYAGVRVFGLDPFASAEMVNILLRIVGFITAYQFSRRVLRLAFPWALLGAALFTLSISTYQQSAHAQILSVALAPGAALLAVRTMRALEAGRTMRALEAGRSRAAFGWGAGLAVLASAWLMTAFYLAWLLGFYAAVLVLAVLATSPEVRRRMSTVLRREWLSISAIALVFAVTVVPFLILYLPKASESGMHSFAALRPYFPSPADTLRVGPGNLLFGWSDRFFAPADATTSAERIVGWPPIHLACFLAAAWSWRRSQAMRPVLLAIGAVYALTLNVGGVSGWWLVYQVVPGGKAIRVVARAWIVLAAGPVLCVVLLWLQDLSASRPAAAAILATLLVAEQLSSGPNVARLDRLAELRHLDAVLPAPANCRAFTVLSARSDDPEVDETLQTLSANANAMLIAEVANLPTINGVSSFNPPDWNAADPSSSSYLGRMSAYAQAHRVNGLCGLDLRTGRWYDDVSRYEPVHLMPTGGLLSLRPNEAGTELLGSGWYAPEAWGRWGGARATLRFLPQGGEGKLKLTAWALAIPHPPAQTQRVTVIANGEPAATWTLSATPAEYQVLLPPPDKTRGAVEVTFVAQDPFRPWDKNGAVDARIIGLGLIAVQLDWP